MSDRNLNSMWGNIRRISLRGIARIERLGPGTLMSYQSRCPPGRNTLVTSRATDLRISASRWVCSPDLAPLGRVVLT